MNAIVHQRTATSDFVFGDPQWTEILAALVAMKGADMVQFAYSALYQKFLGESCRRRLPQCESSGQTNTRLLSRIDQVFALLH